MDRIKIKSVTTLAEHWGALRQADVEYRAADGSLHHLKREIYDRGNAAAIALFDPARQTVLLVRQARFPALLNGDPAFMLEVCAGMLDGDDPLTCAHKEALEETGHAPRNVRKICDIYPSPGAVQEKVALFVGEYDAQTRQAQGGGLAHEGEDIELVELPLDEALGMIESGELTDAKTIILLQHLALERGA